MAHKSTGSRALSAALVPPLALPHLPRVAAVALHLLVPHSPRLEAVPLEAEATKAKPLEEVVDPLGGLAPKAGGVRPPPAPQDSLPRAAATEVAKVLQEAVAPKAAAHRLQEAPQDSLRLVAAALRPVPAAVAPSVLSMASLSLVLEAFHEQDSVC